MQYRRLVVREELFVLLDNDIVSAHVLGQFIYWTKKVKDYHDWLEEEKLRACGILTDKSCGWIWKSVRELLSELFIFNSQKSLYRRLNQLVDMGILDRRRNPHHKWDRTYQYRLDLLHLANLLSAQDLLLPDKEFEKFYKLFKERKEQVKPQDEVQPTGQSYQNSLPPSHEDHEEHEELVENQKEEVDPETILRMYEKAYRRTTGKEWPCRTGNKEFWQKMRDVLKKGLQESWETLNEEKKKIDWWTDFFKIATCMAQKDLSTGKDYSMYMDPRIVYPGESFHSTLAHLTDFYRSNFSDYTPEEYIEYLRRYKGLLI